MRPNFHYNFVILLSKHLYAKIWPNVRISGKLGHVGQVIIVCSLLYDNVVCGWNTGSVNMELFDGTYRGLWLDEY